jgi:NAD(P)H-hydrate epimerase
MYTPAPCSRQQVRRLDSLAIEGYGVPGLVLMENAGRQCAAVAGEMLGEPLGRRVLIACGRGNNGGDGLVVARHLANQGAHVQVVLVAPIDDVLALDSESAVNLRVAIAMGIPIEEAPSAQAVARAMQPAAAPDLAVDALLGTGAQGEVREPHRSAVEALNRLRCPVLAVDVPSGLDCDTGAPLGIAVRAARTVTFVCPKVGFARPGADAYTGVVSVAEISIPHAAIRDVLGRDPWEVD